MADAPETINRMQSGDLFVTAVSLLLALFMFVAGLWCLLAPESFAVFTGFAPSRHYVHDAGAFQVGIAVTLVLGLIWRRALAVALTGFFIGNTVHMINHFVDLPIGGHSRDPWLLATVSVLAAAALFGQMRRPTP